MIKDYFLLGIENLKRKKIRTALTLIGIFISIATIFTLISLSIGLNDAIKEQFRMLGTDKFFIQPKGQAGSTGSGGAVQLTIKDAEVVEKVNGVGGVSYFAIGNAKISYKNQNRYYMILGLPFDKKSVKLVFEAMNMKIDEGRLIREGEKRKIFVEKTANRIF